MYHYRQQQQQQNPNRVPKFAHKMYSLIIYIVLTKPHFKFHLSSQLSQILFPSLKFQATRVPEDLEFV